MYGHPTTKEVFLEATQGSDASPESKVAWRMQDRPGITLSDGVDPKIEDVDSYYDLSEYVSSVLNATIPKAASYWRMNM